MYFLHNPFAVKVTSSEEVDVVLSTLLQHRFIPFDPGVPVGFSSGYLSGNIHESKDILKSFSNFSWLIHQDRKIYTFDEFMSIAESPQSVEEVFVQFLKHHRKFSAYKRNCADYPYMPTRVQRAENLLNYEFDWTRTPEEGVGWQELFDKWQKLIEHFSLTGKPVNLQTILNHR